MAKNTPPLPSTVSGAPGAPSRIPRGSVPRNVLRASSVLPQAAVPQQQRSSGRHSPFVLLLLLMVVFVIILFIIGWFVYIHFSSGTAAQNAGVGANANNSAALGGSFPAAETVETETTPPLSVDDDADNDGLTDAQEEQYGTDRLVADTDKDGLSDRAEVEVYKTNPKNPDTDGDGFSDGEEVSKLYNPNGEGELRDVNAAIQQIDSSNL